LRPAEVHIATCLTDRAKVDDVICGIPVVVVVGYWSTRYLEPGVQYHGRRDARTTTVKTVPRCSSRSVVRLGLFNARSVGEKSGAVLQRISDMKLSLTALVETWHDDASSPQLIACAPPGFKFVQSARPRKGSSTTSTNHGGVFLYYKPSLHARTVQLPVFSTFEVVAAFLHRAGSNAVVVYRRGSYKATQSFFDDFCDLLERLSTLSAPQIF